MVRPATGGGDVRIWGLDHIERLRRIGQRIGVADVSEATTPATGTTLLVAAHVLLEDRLMAALLDAPGVVLTEGAPVAACCDAARAAEVAEILRSGLVPAGGGWTTATAEAPRFAYNAALRKRAVPFVLNTRTTPQRDIEWRMFGASYKGATDFITKWVWPVPAFHATRASAVLGLSPNFITLISLLLVIAAFVLFAGGHFGWGLAAAWPMTFLDTVDGKLARVTVTSSKWGNVFDHGIDMIHPPFWWWAWTMGLAATLGAKVGGVVEPALWIVVGGYVVGRLIEGAFIARFKFEMHVWRPFDFWLRTITARRNPNLAILTVGTALGAPEGAFVAVAAWTGVCLALHLARLVQAMTMSDAVDSFLAAGAHRP